MTLKYRNPQTHPKHKYTYELIKLSQTSHIGTTRIPSQKWRKTPNHRQPQQTPCRVKSALRFLWFCHAQICKTGSVQTQSGDFRQKKCLKVVLKVQIFRDFPDVFTILLHNYESRFLNSASESRIYFSSTWPHTNTSRDKNILETYFGYRLKFELNNL